MSKVGLYVAFAVILTLLAIGLLVAFGGWGLSSFRRLFHFSASTELGLPKVDKNICPR